MTFHLQIRPETHIIEAEPFTHRRGAPQPVAIHAIREVFELKKIALLLMLILCLSPMSSLAEVRRGDHGEEVRYLQWLLQQTGWLSDAPDGSFGPRTEQAVIDYQKSKGYEETGVADDALMLELDEDRVRHDQEVHGPDYYQPYPGNYEPAAVAEYGAPAHCRTTVLPDILYRDSCADHIDLLNQEYNLVARGDAASFTEASELWRQEMERLFEAWQNSAPNARGRVDEAREAWNASFQAQYGALCATFDDPVAIERQLLLMYKNLAGTLCESLSGDMPGIPAEDYTPSTGGASAEPHCEQWAINAGTEFFTGCAVHAPLFAREFEWTRAGADDAAALNALLADWDDALAALYDLWAERAGDDSAIRAARDAAQQALVSLDGAMSGNALAPLTHMRAVQLECTRLCGLLNGN